MPELFGNFEVNNQPWWQPMLRLIGASFVLHLVVVMGALYVPGVRDAFNIAALLSKTKYVDKPYVKTEVAEEVRVVKLEPQFHYPEGYFALEPGLIPSPSPTPLPFLPQVLAVKHPPPLPVPSPSPSPIASPSPAASPAVVASNSPSPTPKDPQEVEKELNRIANDNSVVRPSEDEVNTRPLKDWLARANALKESGKLDLSSELEITIAANLDKGCKLVDPVLIQKSGDSRIVDVAKEMVAAIGDSGMLSFLRDPKKVKDPNTVNCDELPLQITLKLDKNELTARVESQADTPERAAQMADGYNQLLAIGQLVKRGKDEEQLYRSTKVTSEGKQIIVNFSMPRETAGDLLKRQLPTPAG